MNRMYHPTRALRLFPFLVLFAPLCVVVAGCTSSAKVEVPILAQELPPLPAGTRVDLYWTPRSYEQWLQLPADPQKAPDLAAARINDTHVLWENRGAEAPHSKVADLEVSGQINRKHPREWLLLDLGKRARELGANGVVINSLDATTLSGFAQPEGGDALRAGDMTLKVWIYAQAVRYD